MPFFRRQDGYALALTLLFLPVLLGLGLLIIDLGRANNAHADITAATDALALAGALELDGKVSSISRAKVAMSKVHNTAGFFKTSSSPVALDFDVNTGGAFEVFFLTNLPVSDDTPVTREFLQANETGDGTQAKYIYVVARMREFTSLFPAPVLARQVNLQLEAQAAAVSNTTACNITPLFICNPFENVAEDFDLLFSQGKFHGRLIKIHPKGSQTAGPGNFGYLTIGDGNAGASAIREYFASGKRTGCFPAETVTTEPGAATSIRTGINVRFDVYEASFKNDKSKYPPAANTRKGYISTKNGAAEACSGVLGSQTDQVLGFPENDVMAPPSAGSPGAYIGSGSWDVGTYWAINHPGRLLPNFEDISSFPNAIAPGASVPSRYDIYRYEIDQTALGNDLIGDTSVGGETGLPQCHMSATNGTAPPEDPDRRTIVAAVVNCLENDPQGRTDLPVEAYVKAFLVSPVGKNGEGDATIDLEIIDISGNSGFGELDDNIRNETQLVR